jgi:hypothetical protein
MIAAELGKTTPPPPAPQTVRDLPAEDETSVIRAGCAQAALSEALAHLQAAHMRLEAVAMACARVVDLGAHP